MTAHSPRRGAPLGPKLAMLVLLGLGFLLGLGVGAFKDVPPGGGGRPLVHDLLLGGGGLVLLALAVMVSVLYWRRLDEAAREAHKWAWFWGGSLGLIPGVVVGSSETLSVRTAASFGFVEPHQLVNFGVVAVLVSMLAGYLVAWAVWWLWRR